MSEHREYWDEFYASARRDEVPKEPSDFARWVADRVVPETFIVDVGCGNARDSLWFANRGHGVCALDYSPASLGLGRRQAEIEGVDVTFQMVDLYDQLETKALVGQFADDQRPLAVYARFLLHALEPEGQGNLFMLAAELLTGRGACYLEFRTGRDRDAAHVFGEHFRSYPEPDLMVDMLEQTGARVVERVEGTGLAPYLKEDPHVCRLVAEWSA